MNTSEVLYRAADLIEERGFFQFTIDTSADEGEAAWFPKPTDCGPLCVEGGIYAAALHGENERAKRALRAYLEMQHLFTWSDHPDRTAAEVIEVLRAAAVIEAAKENADARESVSA